MNVGMCNQRKISSLSQFIKYFCLASFTPIITLPAPQFLTISSPRFPASLPQQNHYSLLGFFLYALWSRKCLRKEDTVIVGLISCFCPSGLTSALSVVLGLKIIVLFCIVFQVFFLFFGVFFSIKKTQPVLVVSSCLAIVFCLFALLLFFSLVLIFLIEFISFKLNQYFHY